MTWVVTGLGKQQTAEAPVSVSSCYTWGWIHATGDRSGIGSMQQVIDPGLDPSRTGGRSGTGSMQQVIDPGLDPSNR